MADNTASVMRIHPDFSEPQDVVIESNDNVRFYVASTDLARASGVYRARLSQPPSTTQGPQIIQSYEGSTVLDFLLKIATGRSPTLHKPITADAIEEVLDAAKRLEMDLATTFAVSLLRARVMEMTSDPVKQYAMAARHGWTDLYPVFLARAVTVAVNYTSLPSMPTSVINSFLAHREARIAHVIKVMTWSGQPNLPFHHEINNRCTTCIQSNCTKNLSHKHQVLWRRFQLNIIVRFRAIPSLDGLAQYEWVAKVLADMAGAKEECGHNPWNGIEKKIPHLLDGFKPPQ